MDGAWRWNRRGGSWTTEAPRANELDSAGERRALRSARLQIDWSECTNEFPCRMPSRDRDRVRAEFRHAGRCRDLGAPEREIGARCPARNGWLANPWRTLGLREPRNPQSSGQSAIGASYYPIDTCGQKLQQDAPPQTPHVPRTSNTSRFCGVPAANHRPILAGPGHDLGLDAKPNDSSYAREKVLGDPDFGVTIRRSATASPRSGTLRSRRSAEPVVLRLKLPFSLPPPPASRRGFFMKRRSLAVCRRTSRAPRHGTPDPRPRHRGEGSTGGFDGLTRRRPAEPDRVDLARPRWASMVPPTRAERLPSRRPASRGT